MAKLGAKLSTGIFITEEYLYFAQVSEGKDKFIIEQLRSVPTPHRSYINGKVKDQDALANQIIKALSEYNFSSSNISLAFSDTSFIKHIDNFKNVPDFELRHIIEEKIFSDYSFLEEEVFFGYQKLPNMQGEFFENTKVLYGFVPKSKLLNLKDVTDLIDLSPLAIDLEPLAVNRAVFCNNNYNNLTVISIYLSPDFMDISISKNGDILLTQTIKGDLERIFSNPMSLEEVLQKVKNIIYSFENHYPTTFIDKVIIIPAKDSLNIYLDELKNIFIDYDVERYLIKESNFDTVEFQLDTAGIVENANSFLAPIGLALRNFPKYSKDLNLIRVKKQIDPIINRIEIALLFTSVLIIGLIFFGFSVYLKSYAVKIDNKTQQIKNEIRAYQTGEYIQRQKRLKNIQEHIKYFEGFEDSYLNRTNLLIDLVKNLPEDITFNTFSLNKDNIVLINGTSYFPSSIHLFYKRLQKLFFDVQISKLNISYQKDEVPTIKFDISFRWGK